MAVPRLLEAELAMRFPLLLVFTFLVLTIAAGSAGAWQHKGGMAGLFPARRAVWAGVFLAVVTGVVVAGILQALDPVLRDAIIVREDRQLWTSTFPSTPTECISRILWGAGFQTLFFTAAAMGFFARLIGRVWLAIVFTVCLHAIITVRKFGEAGLSEVTVPYTAIAMINGLVSCLLYARAGLPSAMTFSATTDLRHFLNLEIAQSWP